MSHAAEVFFDQVETPLGPMVTGATKEHLVLLEFADRPLLPTQLDRVAARVGGECAGGSSPVIDQLRTELAEFFDGRRRHFDVPLRYPGTTFQESVWRELLTIPVGTTRSYSDVARAIGRPTAVRAVAHANGDNRIAILIPCHRVIGSNGTLTGYGGGLWRKQKLLELEGGVGRLL